MPDTERPVFNQPLADRFLSMVAGLNKNELTEQRVKGLREVAGKNEVAVLDALSERLARSYSRKDVDGMRRDLAVAHFLGLDEDRENDKLPDVRRELRELRQEYLPEPAPTVSLGEQLPGSPIQQALFVQLDGLYRQGPGETREKEQERWAQIADIERHVSDLCGLEGLNHAAAAQNARHEIETRIGGRDSLVVGILNSAPANSPLPQLLKDEKRLRQSSVGLVINRPEDQEIDKVLYQVAEEASSEFDKLRWELQWETQGRDLLDELKRAFANVNWASARSYRFVSDLIGDTIGFLIQEAQKAGLEVERKGDVFLVRPKAPAAASAEPSVAEPQVPAPLPEASRESVFNQLRTLYQQNAGFQDRQEIESELVRLVAANEQARIIEIDKREDKREGARRIPYLAHHLYTSRISLWLDQHEASKSRELLQQLFLAGDFVIRDAAANYWNALGKHERQDPGSGQEAYETGATLGGAINYEAGVTEDESNRFKETADILGQSRKDFESRLTAEIMPEDEELRRLFTEIEAARLAAREAIETVFKKLGDYFDELAQEAGIKKAIWEGRAYQIEYEEKPAAADLPPAAGADAGLAPAAGGLEASVALPPAELAPAAAAGEIVQVEVTVEDLAGELQRIAGETDVTPERLEELRQRYLAERRAKEEE